MKYPKMRPVTAFPVTYSGKQMICLKDASGLVENTVVVPKPIFFIISMLNGKNTIRDIQAAYMRQFGDMLFSDDVQKIIEDLGKNLFLEGERLEAYLHKIKTEFKQAATRPFLHLGNGPHLEPERFKGELASYFRHPDGPGERSLEIPSGTIKGIMVPHIDYMRGGPCYAWGYRGMENLGDVDTIIILGINHTAGDPLFSVTPKPFETPLGLMETDKDFIQTLIEKCAQDLLEGEFYHRGEHSVELQTVWLKYLYADKEDVKIVPVLCGSFDTFIAQGVSPIQDARVGDLINGIKETITALGRKVCLMASVDLSHIGPPFGDGSRVSLGDLADIRGADLETLKFVEALDREGFWQSVARDANRRHICGLSAIYTLLSIIEAREGKLLKYAQWRDEQGWGCVTFASMIFCQ
ncbi:MAG: AmmeMemoRadiSam system protein B [Deltaproteobacteria bacterium]|nr:MAG: AmmeMemoRadiSam system protein B [Deltaproteobacteria bacterium]